MALRAPMLDARIDERRFRSAVHRFTRQLGPKASDKATRKIALDVTDRIVRSLNGLYGRPKRIDTGRYRAAWVMGTEKALGSSRGLPSAAQSVDMRNPSQQSDGTGELVKRGLSTVVTVTNNVEYGIELEYGTASMAAGMHRAEALLFVAKEVEAVTRSVMREAWES